MGSERASYWIAVAVLAVLAINKFAVQHEYGVRSLACRSLAAVEQVSPRAASVVAMAEMMLRRDEFRFAHAQMALDGVQTRLASAQAVLARHEAVFARVQATDARMAAMEQLNRTVICPRQHLGIVIPRPPAMPRDGTI